MANLRTSELDRVVTLNSLDLLEISKKEIGDYSSVAITVGDFRALLGTPNHSIAGFHDTIATGAQLTQLVDGSTTTLHNHGGVAAHNHTHGTLLSVNDSVDSRHLSDAQKDILVKTKTSGSTFVSDANTEHIHATYNDPKIGNIITNKILLTGDDGAACSPVSSQPYFIIDSMDRECILHIAQSSIDAADRKAYLSIRNATYSTVSNFYTDPDPITISLPDSDYYPESFIHPSSRDGVILKAIRTSNGSPEYKYYFIFTERTADPREWKTSNILDVTSLLTVSSDCHGHLYYVPADTLNLDDGDGRIFYVTTDTKTADKTNYLVYVFGESDFRLYYSDPTTLKTTNKLKNGSVAPTIFDDSDTGSGTGWVDRLTNKPTVGSITWSNASDFSIGICYNLVASKLVFFSRHKLEYTYSGAANPRYEKYLNFSNSYTLTKSNVVNGSTTWDPVTNSNLVKANVSPNNTFKLWYLNYSQTKDQGETYGTWAGYGYTATPSAVTLSYPPSFYHHYPTNRIYLVNKIPYTPQVSFTVSYFNDMINLKFLHTMPDINSAIYLANSSYWAYTNISSVSGAAYSITSTSKGNKGFPIDGAPQMIFKAIEDANTPALKYNVAMMQSYSNISGQTEEYLTVLKESDQWTESDTHSNLKIPILTTGISGLLSESIEDDTDVLHPILDTSSLTFEPDPVANPYSTLWRDKQQIIMAIKARRICTYVGPVSTDSGSAIRSIELVSDATTGSVEFGDSTWSHPQSVAITLNAVGGGSGGSATPILHKQGTSWYKCVGATVGTNIGSGYKYVNASMTLGNRVVAHSTPNYLSVVLENRNPHYYIMWVSKKEILEIVAHTKVITVNGQSVVMPYLKVSSTNVFLPDIDSFFTRKYMATTNTYATTSGTSYAIKNDLIKWASSSTTFYTTYHSGNQDYAAYYYFNYGYDPNRSLIYLVGYDTSITISDTYGLYPEYFAYYFGTAAPLSPSPRLQKIMKRSNAIDSLYRTSTAAIGSCYARWADKYCRSLSSTIITEQHYFIGDPAVALTTSPNDFEQFEHNAVYYMDTRGTATAIGTYTIPYPDATSWGTTTGTTPFGLAVGGMRLVNSTSGTSITSYPKLYAPQASQCISYHPDIGYYISKSGVCTQISRNTIAQSAVKFLTSQNPTSYVAKIPEDFGADYYGINLGSTFTADDPAFFRNIATDLDTYPSEYFAQTNVGYSTYIADCSMSLAGYYYPNLLESIGTPSSILRQENGTPSTGEISLNQPDLINGETQATTYIYLRADSASRVTVLTRQYFESGSIFNKLLVAKYICGTNGILSCVIYDQTKILTQDQQNTLTKGKYADSMHRHTFTKDALLGLNTSNVYFVTVGTTWPPTGAPNWTTLPSNLSNMFDGNPDTYTTNGVLKSTNSYLSVDFGSPKKGFIFVTFDYYSTSPSLSIEMSSKYSHTTTTSSDDDIIITPNSTGFAAKNKYETIGLGGVMNGQILLIKFTSSANGIIVRFRSIELFSNE